MTIIHEASGIETLDLQPAYCHHWNEKEYVRVGVPEPGDLVSLVLAHFCVDGKAKVLQAVLSVEEVDEVIRGLEIAMHRARRMRDESKQETP